MDSMDTEKEQLDQIKKWIQENGLSLVLGIVLGLGGVYGWRAWQVHQVEVSQGVSAQLATVMTQLSRGQYEVAVSQAEQLVSDHDGSLYADMSRLIIARARVEQGLLEKAIAPLDQVAMQGEKSAFAPVARLRLARVYLALSRYDDAEQLISGDVPKSYAAVYEELRGDLSFAKGQLDAARAAYFNAISLTPVGTDTGFLQMKLNDLPQKVGDDVSSNVPVTE